MASEHGSDPDQSKPAGPYCSMHGRPRACERCYTHPYGMVPKDADSVWGEKGDRPCPQCMPVRRTCANFGVELMAWFGSGIALVLLMTMIDGFLPFLRLEVGLSVGRVDGGLAGVRSREIATSWSLAGVETGGWLPEARRESIDRPFLTALQLCAGVL